MHYSWTLDTTDITHLRESPYEFFRKGPLLVPRRGMHIYASRLVDDDYIVIVVYDIKLQDATVLATT